MVLMAKAAAPVKAGGWDLWKGWWRLVEAVTQLVLSWRVSEKQSPKVTFPNGEPHLEEHTVF